MDLDSSMLTTREQSSASRRKHIKMKRVLFLPSSGHAFVYFLSVASYETVRELTQ